MVVVVVVVVQDHHRRQIRPATFLVRLVASIARMTPPVCVDGRIENLLCAAPERATPPCGGPVRICSRERRWDDACVIERAHPSQRMNDDGPLGPLFFGNKNKMLKGNSKIQKISVDSEAITGVGKILSTIEIVLLKN